MRFSKGIIIWAFSATVLLATSLAWPDAPRRGLDALTQAGHARVAQAHAMVTTSVTFLPPTQQGSVFVREVQARRLRRAVTAFDPKPGQVFLVTANGTRAR